MNFQEKIEIYKDIIVSLDYCVNDYLYILDVENDGMAYLGFHFICSWDEDHDYGVMMHKERVVKMGGGDVAFLSWIAEEDKKASEIV